MAIEEILKILAKKHVDYTIDTLDRFEPIIKFELMMEKMRIKYEISYPLNDTEVLLFETRSSKRIRRFIGIEEIIEFLNTLFLCSKCEIYSEGGNTCPECKEAMLDFYSIF